MAEEEARGAGREALREAWERFAVCDLNAGNVQKRFLGLRLSMLVIGVAATALAVLYSQIAGDGRPSPGQWQFYLWLLVIAAPIAGSVLAAGSVKLDRSLNWILLRGAAEEIKREIYRYRCRVGLYNVPDSERPSRDEKLATRISEIMGRLRDTEVVEAGLTPYRDEVLPPKYGAAPDDDGFSDLTPETYLDWRLGDQLAYFRGKAGKLERQLRRLHWLIAVLGGVGTFLAAVGLVAWVPVSVALSAALGGFLQLRGIETLLSGTNRAVLELENVKIWWSGLEGDGRPAQLASLVRRAESALQREASGWAEEMQQALEELREEQQAQLAEK